MIWNKPSNIIQSFFASSFRSTSRWKYEYWCLNSKHKMKHYELKTFNILPELLIFFYFCQWTPHKFWNPFFLINFKYIISSNQLTIKSFSKLIQCLFVNSFGKPFTFSVSQSKIGVCEEKIQRNMGKWRNVCHLAIFASFLIKIPQEALDLFNLMLNLICSC